MRIRVLLGAALAAAALSSCANEDRGKEAGELARDLKAQPGVTSVDLDYTKPVTLDTGKLQVNVTMDKGASKKELLAVGRTIYAAFSGQHALEEGDADVKVGASTVHLRSFEPDAETDDVVREWGIAADLATKGAVEAVINTDDVTKGDKVESDFVLTLGDGTDRDDVTSTLDSLATEYGESAQRGWGVTAASGSGLTREPGFPTTGTIASWEELESLADGLRDRAFVGVDLREVAARKGKKPIQTVIVSLSGIDRPIDASDPASRRALLKMANDHAAALRDATETYTYSLVIDGEEVARIDPGLCAPGEEEFSTLDGELHTEANCPLEEPGSS